MVRIDASGICGSDLHLFHGRIPLEQGFTLGHEYVGTVIAAGDGVTEVAVGDRVLGTFHSACGKCFFCRMGEYTKCDEAPHLRARQDARRASGHPGRAGAGAARQPHAAASAGGAIERLGAVRGRRDGHRLPRDRRNAGLKPGDTCAVIGLGPVGLCAVMAARVAGAARVIAIDTVPERLEVARALGAEPVHATEEDPRAAVKDATAGRGVDVAVDAVGNAAVLDLACRLARKAGTVSVVGVFSERIELHMGVVWIKNLKLVAGQANVIGHLDAVLSLMAAGRLDPTPLVTHHMKLADAQEAYDAYASHQALKIVLSA